MRHQASQLGSIKNLDINELEDMRKENERRLKELEEVYMSKKENSQVGRIIRDRMGLKSTVTTNESPRGPDFDRAADESRVEGGILKKKKSVKIFTGSEAKENEFSGNNQSRLPPGGKPASILASGAPPSRSPSRSRPAAISRSNSRKQIKEEDSPPQYNSPR